MIVGMYLEYLWAADWPEIPAHCEDRDSLPWLDFANCFHRYTFSHAMLRGQNLKVFGVVGTCVAVCFIAVERKRVHRLQILLSAHIQKISAASAQEGNSDSAFTTDACYALWFLPVYFRLISGAFLGVLLLVPFHLERPRLHYGCTGCVVACMFIGVCVYTAMPLGAAAEALSISAGKAADGAPLSSELLKWAQRHHLVRQRVRFLIALHFILPATVAVHHFAWADATGRLFGACEVLTILSYQIFVAILVGDDFAGQTVDNQQPKVTNDAPKKTDVDSALLVGSPLPGMVIGGLLEELRRYKIFSLDRIGM